MDIHMPAREGGWAGIAAGVPSRWDAGGHTEPTHTRLLTGHAAPVTASSLIPALGSSAEARAPAEMAGSTPARNTRTRLPHLVVRDSRACRNPQVAATQHPNEEPAEQSCGQCGRLHGAGDAEGSGGHSG